MSELRRPEYELRGRYASRAVADILGFAERNLASMPDSRSGYSAALTVRQSTYDRETLAASKLRVFSRNGGRGMAHLPSPMGSACRPSKSAFALTGRSYNEVI